MKSSWIASITIFSVLILDQVVKFYIKLTYPLGGGFDMFGLKWAKIHFVENKGMAFGMSFGGELGKLALSSFRIVMVAVLVYLLTRMIKSKEAKGLIVFFSMIIAGALGNIIDSVFYGKIFSASTYYGAPAELFPASGGYEGWLHGRVVDMLYFPMFHGHFPSWLPRLGGQEFEFFSPVFNIADSFIFIGVVGILLFYRNSLKS